MRIAVLGAGVVGRTLATAWAQRGHEVALGSRASDNPAGTEWAAHSGGSARSGTFADAANGADVVVNATPGLVSLNVLTPLSETIAGAVLIDVGNPLDFSAGVPPTVAHRNGLSLGEQLQAALPHVRVVKALNTVTAGVMVDPAQVPGAHTLFVCGDDEAAKDTVRGLLAEFGWAPAQVLDLGNITAARATEMYLLLWLRIMQARNSPMFNVAVMP